MLKFLRTGTVGIRETFGKFSEICPPGLTLYIPFAQTIRVVNTQQNQLNLKLDARTSDNAFAHVSLTIQYRIDPENAAKALYRMNDPTEVFKDSSKIVNEIQTSLGEKLNANGYTLVDAFITDVEPDAAVKEAMNKVLASERLKDAAKNEAEASKIRIVADAEADKQKKQLNGEGLAAQRNAMMDGLHVSISKMTEGLKISHLQAIQLALYAQYYDTLKEMAKTSNTKTVFMPYSPEKLDGIRSSFLEAQQVD